MLQFQRAAAIRDLFFGGGGATPSVKFEITPVPADPGTRKVTLDLNGVTITYDHGPILRPIQVTWPGSQGVSRVRLVFDPAPNNAAVAIEEKGPWALFRVFGKGKMTQQGGSEEYLLSFHLGEREATFQIRAGSVNNPFSPGLLKTFSCPQIS